MKTRELQPIKEDVSDYDRLEEIIRDLFRREIFLPLLRFVQINPNLLLNANENLVSAIQSGQITFSRGSFRGRFDSKTSRELSKLGAKWDRTQGSWKVLASSLPQEIRAAISTSEASFAAKLFRLDERLKKILPEEIADKLFVSKLFDRTLFKVDKDFRGTLKTLTVPPELTKERRKKISEEWQNNLRLYVRDFTKKEIKQLRKDVQTSVFAGNRYESLVKTIQKRYEVSANKAKFLARQETSLLMTKFKESRYQESGISEYKWVTVAGSPKHPVRPDHKRLEGKIFRWDDPPITNRKTGARNNPGQDFNCRCFARPVVRFK